MLRLTFLCNCPTRHMNVSQNQPPDIGILAIGKRNSTIKHLRVLDQKPEHLLVFRASVAGTCKVFLTAISPRHRFETQTHRKSLEPWAPWAQAWSHSGRQAVRQITQDRNVATFEEAWERNILDDLMGRSFVHILRGFSQFSGYLLYKLGGEPGELAIFLWYFACDRWNSQAPRSPRVWSQMVPPKNYRKATPGYRWYGGFLSHGVPPIIHRWIFHEKMQWFLEVPPFQETSICISYFSAFQLSMAQALAITMPLLSRHIRTVAGRFKHL